MLSILLAYALSGFIALGYQTAWFRLFVDRFGCTSLTFLLVVCCFIGGLGAGGLASRRVTRRLSRELGITDPFRLYGALELLIAFLALLTVAAGQVPAGSWGPFPYVSRGVFHAHHPLYQISKVVLGAACVFLPCFFMGTTFPLLCRIFLDDERFPSRLYAWNTLGACTGVLACQGVLLPRIGHDLSYLVMFGINLLLGLWFLVRGGAPPLVEDVESEKDSRSAGSEAALLLWTAALGGFLAGCLEGDLYKRLTFLDANSSAGMALLSFWAILAIFLASMVVRHFASLKPRHLHGAYVAAALIYWFSGTHLHALEEVFVGMTRARSTEAAALSAQDLDLYFPASFSQLFLVVGILVFPAYFLVSLLFPFTCNRLQEDRHHLGMAAGLNTLAFCSGMLLFSRVAPLVDGFYSMNLMFPVLGVLVASVIFLTRRWSWWNPVVVAAAIAVAAYLTPPGFDATYVSPWSPAARYPVHTVKSNGEDTTYVVQDPEGPRLFFNAYSMSGTGPGASRYMRLMSHYPLLAHPAPKRALHIGFGCGNTTSATALHRSIEGIDVVELNEKVIETAPQFAAANREVYKDPRVVFIRDDGRNYLNVTDRKYDLITTEPPPPMTPGVYRLYSLDFYRSARAHLTPRGLMSQWLPIYQMPPEAVTLAISTFLAGFDHAVLLTGWEEELFIVGSQEPIDVSLIERRLGSSPEIMADLQQVLVKDVVAFMALHLMGDATLRRTYPLLPVIQDQRNDLEFLYCRPDAHPVISYDPYQVLHDIQAEKLTCFAALKPVVTHLGRLMHRAPDFPMHSLLQVKSSPERPVALSGVDWKRYFKLLERLENAPRSGAFTEAESILREILTLSPELPGVHLDLANMLRATGRLDEAAAEIAIFHQLEPDSASSEAVGR